MGRRGDVEQGTDETLIKSQVNISEGAGPQVCRRKAPLPDTVNQEGSDCVCVFKGRLPENQGSRVTLVLCDQDSCLRISINSRAP